MSLIYKVSFKDKYFDWPIDTWDDLMFLVITRQESSQEHGCTLEEIKQETIEIIEAAEYHGLESKLGWSFHPVLNNAW